MGGAVLGTPALNGANVLAVPVWSSDATKNGTYLVNATNGASIRFFAGGKQFSQPTFAGRYLFTAASSGPLVAWRLP
jgi:hypothetical protein